MALQLEKILAEYHISYSCSGSEISKGWIGIQCPWCGDDKMHLGYNQSKDLLTCWRCGPKKMFPTLKRLLNLRPSEISKLMKKYGALNVQETNSDSGEKKNSTLILPENFSSIKNQHKEYLKQRGFEPEEIASRWGIMGTGNNDKTGFANRIIIPIYQNKKLVSFHSRDITGEARIPKKACPIEREVVHFKDTLYGYDFCNSNSVIVSEGPFDVWRWGYGAVCTWGIKFSERQVDLLTTFRNIFIVFDSADIEAGKEEKQALEQAEKLADRLAIFQNVWVIDDLGSDPGDMPQKKANSIRRRINKILEGVQK